MSKNDYKLASQQASEYAMALDLLAKMSSSESETNTIENILELFTMLFAPGKLRYISMDEGKIGKIYHSPSLSFKDESTMIDSINDFSGNYSWNDSGNGFIIRIKHNNILIGLIDVDGFSYPEYSNHYLNLALSIVDICGLIIENSKNIEKLKNSERQLKIEKERAELALLEVKTLTGLLPICMHCKNIRDDKGYWNRIEDYIQSHTAAEFSHGICQDCLDTYYPSFDK